MGFLSPTDNVSLWVWYQNHDPAISEKILKLSTTRILILLCYWIFHSHLITIKVYYYTITTVIFTILTSGVISWLTSSSQPKHTHRNLFVFSRMRMVRESILAFWEVWKRMRCFHLLHYYTDFCFFEKFMNFWHVWKNISGIAITGAVRGWRGYWGEWN